MTALGNSQGAYEDGKTSLDQAKAEQAIKVSMELLVDKYKDLSDAFGGHFTNSENPVHHCNRNLPPRMLGRLQFRRQHMHDCEEHRDEQQPPTAGLTPLAFRQGESLVRFKQEVKK